MTRGDREVQPIVVSIADARAMSGLGKTTLFRLINSGALESTKLGRRRLIKVDSLKKLVGAS